MNATYPPEREQLFWMDAIVAEKAHAQAVGLPWRLIELEWHIDWCNRRADQEIDNAQRLEASGSWNYPKELRARAKDWREWAAKRATEQMTLARAVYSLVAVLGSPEHTLTPVVGGEVRGL